MALSEQRLNQLNARAVDIETRLRGKEVELAQTRTQFTQLTADFRYNLKLLEDRDAELARLDSTVAVHRAACDKAEHNLAHARGLVNEKDAELRRQKNRVGELEAYHAEKVERLRKQTVTKRIGCGTERLRTNWYGKNDYENKRLSPGTVTSNAKQN